MGRSLMPLSRNHHLIKSLLEKRTFHRNGLGTSSSSSFNERESHEKKRESFLVQRYCSESDALYFTVTSTENWAPLREIRLPFFQRWRCVSGSCEGILHLYDNSRIGLLWKPSTNEFKEVSPSKVPHVHPKYPRPKEPYGLGFDSQSQDYKVVKFSRDSLSQSRIELYSLLNDSWKEISEDLGREWDHTYSTQAYVNGRYYWHSQPEKKIVSFDFTSEKFSHIILPPIITNFELLGKYDTMREQYCFKLGEFDGKLGFILYTSYSVELWVLQEDGSWTSQFEIHFGKDVLKKPLLLSSDGHFLFLQGFDDELMVYDLRIEELKELFACDPYVKVFPYLVTAPVCAP